VTESGLFM